jgi:hypothetical protein
MKRKKNVQIIWSRSQKRLKQKEKGKKKREENEQEMSGKCSLL